MRLVSEVRELSTSGALTTVQISTSSAFHVAGKGVPAWVALEYIGQTAALIGLYAMSDGDAARVGVLQDQDSEGFLLASRSMTLEQSWFSVGETLLVSAQQTGDAGASLATFDGSVAASDGRTLVSASLSVWRGNPEAGASGTTTRDEI